MTSTLVKRRSFLTGTGTLAALAILTACGNKPDVESVGSSTPVRGGALTFLIQGFDAGWISSKTSISSYEGNLWGHLTDKLVYVNEKGDLSPWVAESWEENSDATEFVLHLQKDVTFSDGSPVDANAVVENINAWAVGDAERGIAKVGLFPSANFESAKATDTRTVKVNFSSPTLGFIATLGYHGCILLAPATLKSNTDEQADLAKTIGSGPFTLKSWQQGESYVLQRREDYSWGPKALGYSGPAYLDTLTYKVVRDASVRTSTVLSGQADVSFNVEPQEIDSLISQGFSVSTPRYLGFVDGFQVNTQTFPTNQASVRQALQHGIDRQEILSTIYTQDWQAATTFIQGTVPEAGDFADYFAFDQQKATDSLEKDGWKLESDGYRYKDGKLLEITLAANPYVPSDKAVDELIAQQLQRIGIKLNLKVVDVANYSAWQNSEPPLLHTSRSFVDVGTVAGILTNRNGGEDWFKLGDSDQKLNKLSDQIAQARNREERAKVADDLQKYVLDQAYFVPLVQLVQRLYLSSPKVRGIQYNGLAYANFYTAWVTQ
ncbi:ABC transporter substrate-binding protein [Glutamicibacter ectropisis]|uniref:ABC transporter substrate-binding protein n=1 Tax=Glutamicibacter ectropisis TaxID=3046593 RepID=A0AAU6WDH9_9MICC